MSKLSFRARALDPSKPMPIYLAEELPDLPEYSAINRAVPQMPSGMEKEEESEHHLQRAICAGLIIPTPEVFETECEFYDRSYPNTYKMPRQMIHMQPLNLEQDIPDYDMDSGDESWVNSQSKRLDLSYYKFEQMMDRLEKSSGQTVVTLNEAKALLKQDDEVSIAVYDYWLHKRLKTQHPLILTVKTENRGGIAANSPYLAFRRRTEKMQTRKNRKNDEASYEKMLKLRRDLSRAVTLLEMIKKREKTKREQLHLTIEVVEKRYQARDFSGQLQAEYQSQVAKSTTRPAFAPLYANQYSHLAQSSPQHQWSGSGSATGLNHMYAGSGYGAGGGGGGGGSGGLNKRDMDPMNGSSRKEKRQYKKRKHKHTQRDKQRMYSSPGPAESMVSSEEEDLCNVQASESEDEGPFGFKRSKSCQYNLPVQNGFGNWPWTSRDENGSADPRYRFTLTSLAYPRPRCIGFARRRIGRGGRVIIDRMSTDMDELWSRLDYKIFDSAKATADVSSEDSGCVVTALEEPQTQNRLLDINLGSSSNNMNSGRSSGANGGRLATTTTIGGASAEYHQGAGVSATPAGGAGSAEVVIKSEHAAATTTVAGASSSNNSHLTSDSGNLSKVLDRHISSSNVNSSNAAAAAETVASQKSGGGSQSLDRLSTCSGYFSQQSLAGVGGAVTASASLDAFGLMETVSRVRGGEVTRSLSLPLSGPLSTAFQDVSGSPALGRRSESDKVAEEPPVVVVGSQPPLNDGESVDNEDDMSLAELARKSGKSAQSEDELFAMIRKEWLHFRPKPPEKQVLENGEQVNVAEQLPKISSMAPLNLELVTLRTHDREMGRRIKVEEEEANGEELDVDLPSSIFLNSEDNMFQPQPFALDDLEWRSGSAHSSPDSSLAASPLNGSKRASRSRRGGLLDQSLSGDSLNELSLNLGDDETGEDNEKVLENILQECQMGDFKILEDPTIFTGLPDTEEDDDDELDVDHLQGRDANQLKSLFERAVGYESEFVSWALESFKTGNGKRIRRSTLKSVSALKLLSPEHRIRSRRNSNRKVGQTRFKLSRIMQRDETFSPDKSIRTGGGVCGAAGGQTNGGSEFEDEVSGASVVVPHEVVMDGGVVTIKQEPDVLAEDGVLQVQQIKIEKQEDCDQEVVASIGSGCSAGGATTIMVPMASTSAGLQQQQQQQRTTTRNIIFQGGTNYQLAQQGDNTIILTSSLNSVKNHLNGPITTDKTLVTASGTPNKGVQFKRQLTPVGQTKQQLPLTETGGIINNGGGGGGGANVVTTNQKFSLTSVGGGGPNAMPKTISIAGQPGATGNKFYIHPASLVNAAAQQQQQQQQITLTSGGGGGAGGGHATGSTKSLQYLTPANIKFNFAGTTTSSGGGGVSGGQAQDIKSILASSLPSSIIINDHSGNNIVGASSNALPTLLAGQQGQQQQQQQVQVTGAGQVNQQRKTMNVYVDAEKRFLYTNNRGQFVAQLNPGKMVNIVPVQQQQSSGGGGGGGNAGVNATHMQQQQQQQVLGASGSLNSNTKIITTTKGVQQTVLDGSNRIIGTAGQGQQGSGGGATVATRGFPTVQRLRPIRNSAQQQQQLQNAIAKHNSQMVANAGGSGGGEVRTLNRILFQAAAPGSGSSVSIVGGDANGGASSGGGTGASGTTTTMAGGGGAGSGGAAGESSINVNPINR